MTQTDQHIRDRQNEVLAYLLDNPDKSLSTSKISGVVTDGLQCQVRQGRHEVAMDMSTAMGGEATAPSPGFFAKAGVVGCLAIATKMTAAREGMRFRSVHVEIETDTDGLALFGKGGGNAAPLDTRIKISIDSDEPDARVAELIDQVLTIDTWFLALRDAQPVTIGWEPKPRPVRVPSVAAQARPMTAGTTCGTGRRSAAHPEASPDLRARPETTADHPSRP